MKVYQSIEDFQNARNSIPKNKTVGFVPTMGALHEGHLSLIKQSVKDNDVTICSIFVNPTQFDNPHDLEQYPNRLDADQKLLENAGADILWTPTVEDLYPNGPEIDAIDLGELAKPMEGAFRQGHFEGMATVVSRLFKVVQPDRAYFGEKDFQQLQIVRKLNDSQGFSIEIIGMPIVREPNGLAMSSRNLRLSEEERKQASLIYKTLQQIKQQTSSSTPIQLKKLAEENFENSPLRLEYVEIRDEDNLQEIEHFEIGKKYRAFIAAHLGDVRLIDNEEILL